MTPNVKAGQDPKEIFDVVDERDQVIGRKTRAEVHSQGLRHRAVYVFVFNAKGLIFLQKRSLTKDYAPGTWVASCSGHLDAGEDYDVAAARELAEEIGLTPPEPPQRWLRIRACEETGWEFLWLYRLQSEGPFQLNPAEIQDGAWFTPAEITQGIIDRPADFAPSFSYVWRRLALELEEGPLPNFEIPGTP